MRLNLSCAGEAFALGSESGDQARHQGVPSSGQRVKDGEVRMGSAELFNPVFTAADVAPEIAYEPQCRFDHQYAGPNHGLIGGRR